METCHYCGVSYHPMQRWTPKKAVFGMKSLICVCSLRYDQVSNRVLAHDECQKQAEADGYEYRPDLTPKR